MGCYIHIWAEIKKNNRWHLVDKEFTLSEYDRERLGVNKGHSPFNWQNYGLFGFLGDVRNYSCSEYLSKDRGLPNDVSSRLKLGHKQWGLDAHSASYIILKELIEFDYDKTFWDRRITKQTGPNTWSGAALAEEGEGEIITYRQFLGDRFFIHLEELKSLGDPEDVRIVFWFDN